MELTVLRDQDKQEFNRFVAGHQSGSFLQAWEWGQWQKQLGHQVQRFFIKDNDQIVLSAQIIQAAIPRLNKAYLYIPHGPLIHSLDDAGAKKVLAYFFQELARLFPKVIFIRLEPAQHFIDLLPALNIKKTINIQSAKTLVLDLDMPEEQLLANMHPKTRYNIKVAQKHAVAVKSDLVVMPQHGLHLPEIVQLISDTTKRQKYKGHPDWYYKKMIDYFGIQGGDIIISLYKAFHGKVLLAAAIMLDFGPIRTYLFGGSSLAQRNVMAPYLLHWQAISDAKNKGLQMYDFGGSETAGGKGDLGFSRFKLGFGTTLHNFPGAYDIILQPAWYNIYNVFRRINRTFR